MDLSAYARVLLRHKLLVVSGALLAVVFAVLSYYRVDFNSGSPSFEPRKAELWQSQAHVFLTEEGFPAGRRTIPLVTKVVGGETVTVPRYSDPSRFSGLSSLYARLAQSDQVREIMDREGGVPGVFQAVPTVESAGRSGMFLPMVSLFGKATTGPAAYETVSRGLEAFLTYVRSQQAEADIPESQRIDLVVVNAPQPSVLIQPRKKTLPIVVFLAVMIAAIGLAFVLENASRSRRIEAASSPPAPVSERVPKPQRKPEREPVPVPELMAEAESEPAVSTIRRWAWPTR